MSNIHFLSWAEQQTLFNLSCADAETCSQLSSVVCLGFIKNVFKSKLYSNFGIWITRTIHFPLYKDPSPNSAPKKWLSRALQKVQNQHSPRLVDSTVDMFAEHASPVGRERPNALVISLAVATAERLALSAAIRTEKERSQNGKIYLFTLMTMMNDTSHFTSIGNWQAYRQRCRHMKMSSKSWAVDLVFLMNNSWALL